jgi:hypothetical protein
VTLEDPIEYVHQNKNSLISQRQIGLHAATFAGALRATLREDPDVILVGEMRDIETIRLALTAAEVGLLVLATLHTNTAAGTVDRVVDVFPPEQQQQIRIMLAEALVGVISQQLVNKADQSGRMVAYELMISTPAIKTLIREGRTHQIASVIQTGKAHGMRRLENHLILALDEHALSGDFARNVLSEDTGRIRGFGLFRNHGHPHIMARSLDGLGRAVASDSAPKDQNLLFHCANPHARARLFSTTVFVASGKIDLFLFVLQPIANFKGWASLSAH